MKKNIFFPKRGDIIRARNKFNDQEVDGIFYSEDSYCFKIIRCDETTDDLSIHEWQIDPLRQPSYGLFSWDNINYRTKANITNNLLEGFITIDFLAKNTGRQQKEFLLKILRQI